MDAFPSPTHDSLEDFVQLRGPRVKRNTCLSGNERVKISGRDRALRETGGRGGCPVIDFFLEGVVGIMVCFCRGDMAHKRQFVSRLGGRTRTFFRLRKFALDRKKRGVYR